MGGPASRRQLIEGLREQIQRIERRPARRAGHVASRWRELDDCLPGSGFPRGALSELAGGPASGKTALALSVVAATLDAGGLAAWVDGAAELYPPAAAGRGVDLERLLIVRPPEVESARGDGGLVAALWAAEALLASGAFEAVVVDVTSRLERAPPDERMLRRLAAAAEKGGAVGLWLGVARAPRCPTAVRVELEPGEDGPRIRRVLTRGAEMPQVGRRRAGGAAAGPPRGRAAGALIPWRGTGHAA